MAKKKAKKKFKAKKQSKKELNEILGHWRKHYDEAEANQKKATASILRWCKRYYKDTDKYFDGHKCLAKALEHFDLEDPKEVGQLSLEWLVDEFAKTKILQNIPDMDFIYQQLVKNGHDEENSYEFNDMDNHLFYIPTDYVDKYRRSYQVFAMTTQNTNYLVVRKFHEDRDDFGKDFDETCLYRYWDEYDFDDQDTWEVEERDKYKEEGISKAILMADWITLRYSDNIPGRQYDPKRPDLKWYKENNFKTSNFCGCIFKTGKFEIDNTGTIFQYCDVKYIIFYLRWAFGECKEMEKTNGNKR